MKFKKTSSKDSSCKRQSSSYSYEMGANNSFKYNYYLETISNVLEGTANARLGRSYPKTKKRKR